MPEENKQENNTISREVLIEHSFDDIMELTKEEKQELLRMWREYNAYQRRLRCIRKIISEC